MDEDSRIGDEGREGVEREARWRVDWSASREHLRDFEPGPIEAATGGALIYTDEHGVQRRLPPDMSELTSRDVAAAAEATSYELGAADPGYAKLAAIERLNELRIAGKVSEENYLREKRRLQGLR